MSAPTPQNFYLDALASTVSGLSPATFFPPVNAENFTDYSANVICRMKLSVAKNMFQFWAASAELSQNSLSSLVFRTMYDPSSGFVPNSSLTPEDASSNPMSDDFTLGSIITWADPSNVPTNSFVSGGVTYQTLFPQGYLRYLSYLIFNDPNLTTNFLNSQAVMSSVNVQSKSALNTTLKNITAYNYGAISSNSGRQYRWDGFKVNPNTFQTTSDPAVTKKENPSSQIFQQIRTNSLSRITNMNPATEKIIDASGGGYYPSGAWYKMPFIPGDSIYFILNVSTPSNQPSAIANQNLAQQQRKYRVRMFIMDDTPPNSVLSLQNTDSTTGIGGNPIVYGQFSIYPNGQSKVAFGYSYADTSSRPTDVNDINPPAGYGGAPTPSDLTPPLTNN